MPDTLIQFVHDTIFRVDTFFIANTALNTIKASNNQLWTTFIPVLAAIITSMVTLVLFVLTYRKDVKFNKEKYISEQEKYKFEKAHVKRVEIIEKVFSDLCSIHLFINQLNNYFFIFTEQQRTKQFNKIDYKLMSVNESMSNILLYFEDKYYKEVSDLFGAMFDVRLKFNTYDEKMTDSISNALEEITKMELRLRNILQKIIIEQK